MLTARYFHNYQNNPWQWDATQYKNSIPPDTKIFGPVIQSDKITENEIELFIPRLGREKIIKDSICGDNYIFNDSLAHEENERLEWEDRIDCHNRYYSVYLNDSLLRDLKFYNIRFPNQGENGFITHFSTDGCQVGENVLKVVLGYRHPRRNEQKMYQIPFRFSKPK